MLQHRSATPRGFDAAVSKPIMSPTNPHSAPSIKREVSCCKRKVPDPKQEDPSFKRKIRRLKRQTAAGLKHETTGLTHADCGVACSVPYWQYALVGRELETLWQALPHAGKFQNSAREGLTKNNLTLFPQGPIINSQLK